MIDDAGYEEILRVFRFSNIEFLNFELIVLMWSHPLDTEYRKATDRSRNMSVG